MSDQVFVVTDIEVDGPWPGPNSMRSFASVAVTAAGEEVGVFEAVLEPLPGSQPAPQTYEWFQTQGDAWAAATTDPRPIQQVMDDYVAWVQGLGEEREFVAAPLAFDGFWIEYYLRRFTSYAVCQGPYESPRLFTGPGKCLTSYAAGVTGADPFNFTQHSLPKEWFGEVPHTHRAIDDARGYANLLVEVIRKANVRDRV